MLPRTYTVAFDVLDMPNIDLPTMFPPSVARLTFWTNQKTEHKRGIFKGTYIRERFLRFLGVEDLPELKLIEVQTCTVESESAQAIEKAGIALQSGTMFCVMQDVEEYSDVDTDDDDDNDDDDETDDDGEDDEAGDEDDEDDRKKEEANAEIDEDSIIGKACEDVEGDKYLSSTIDGGSVEDVS